MRAGTDEWQRQGGRHALFIRSTSDQKSIQASVKLKLLQQTGSGNKQPDRTVSSSLRDKKGVSAVIVLNPVKSYVLTAAAAETYFVFIDFSGPSAAPRAPYLSFHILGSTLLRLPPLSVSNI